MQPIAGTSYRIHVINMIILEESNGFTEKHKIAIFSPYQPGSKLLQLEKRSNKDVVWEY